MNTENLTKMSAFLRTLPPETFDLNDWVRVTTKRPILGLFSNAGPACGITACACGWAALKGIFPGFRWNDPEDLPPRVENKLAKRVEYSGFTYARPRKRTFGGWKAVEALFGIPRETSRLLFDAEFYNAGAKPCDVARRIDEEIARAQAPANVERTPVAKSLTSQL